LCCLLPMLSLGKQDPKRKQEVLLTKIRTAKNDAEKIQLYEELYHVYMDFDQKRAYKCLDEMLELAVQTHSKKGMEQAEGLKGLYFYGIQKPDSALVHFHRQLKYLSPKQLIQRAKIYCNIGLMYNTMNKADSALVYFNRSLKICRKTDCGNTYCAVLNNLGMTVYTLGNPKKSETYFKEAYTCAIEQKETADLPNIINNLIVASIENGKENPDKFFRELLQKSKYDISNDVKGTVYMNLGSYYFRNSQWVLAKKYFLLSDSVFRKTGQRNPEIVHCLGNIHQQEKQYSEALRYFQTVRSQFPHYNQSGKLYSDIARTYVSQNQLDSAAFYYELGLTTTDSLKMQMVSEALEQTQNNLEFLRKEAEIRELTLEQKIRESNELRVRFIGIGIIVGLVLLVIIAVLYFRKERGKRKLNEALVERKNERIREFSDKVESRNKAIAEIERKFAEYRDKQDMQDQLKEDVIDSLLLDGDKEVFGYYFEDQHKGFYEALKKYAPSLTNNDLRLCSLTRMRLSLKETAEILNLSVDAVKSGRYRVRKKLNLEADENLSDFLNQLK
jgi:tetratricopeptide (TPR) repeat protein